MFFGVLIINWKERKFDIMGMDGTDVHLTREEVLDELKNKRTKDAVAYGLIFYTDNGQLAVHDRVGFAEESLV